MLEVNDFNAIKLGLASPEQIREWSYGEVTKPETINYRTLRPERDGLFCERIFGPTKDWECYCGKYKRIRFKGVVCEKCGVEVARQRVRRERMGHIELASPVSHIWYFKGTPSRMGLLLDISPRNLERVLYFANHIITHVDDEALDHIRSEVDNELEVEKARIEAEFQARTQQLDEERRAKIAEIDATYGDSITRLEEARDGALQEIEQELQELEARLHSLMNLAAPETIVFGDGKPWRKVLIEEDEAINETRLEELEEVVQQAQSKVVNEHDNKIRDIEARRDAEKEQLVYTGQTDRDNASESARKQNEASRKALEEKKQLLSKIRRLALLTETEYRQLSEEFPGVFEASMGAEAVLQILKEMDLDALAEDLRLEMFSTSGQRRKKATKRLRVVEAFRQSGNKPEWMIFTALPVIPPDLRPMVQLDGGRFATSDLNDLYRRVINRNNRLSRLMNLGAPEIIIRNEKRMLQEAVDALIDNGRRGRPVAGSSKHKLKSLSDMLKGKQGRFRQNLLGKRVDYSGRSVIVVGPDLALHQCGLPKKMALELFKPFVMRRLVQHGTAVNIKSAKKIVERMDPEVWDVLEEVTQEYLVLLNRAPTLHRLGIQAFEPKLIEGSAIQLHPLVCSAFNADFDGDQMAVHVPLSQAAQQEARERMLSKSNLLKPSNGEPVITPTRDIVLGVYYMTMSRDGTKGAGKVFSSPEEARLAYDLNLIDLRAPIKVRLPANGVGPQTVDTTVGRLVFADVLPPAMRHSPDVLGKSIDQKGLRRLIGEVYRRYGADRTAEVADHIKNVGFHYSTKGGLTIAINDVEIPQEKHDRINEAEQQVRQLDDDLSRGLLTEDEHERETIRIWTETKEQIIKLIGSTLDPYGSIAMMATSGARGNMDQISQMAGMRGLTADPSGRIIPLPIRSNFREGLSVLEYFISTHGARKGLADTALKTADSGYLTRRLVDVAQDVIIAGDDCGTEDGIWITRGGNQEMLPPMEDRILGRYPAKLVADPETGEVLAERNEEITEEKARKILESSVQDVYVRSPLTCALEYGVCSACYGRDLATGKPIEEGEAVGTMAAQSIGEPGTQLTMRTFHTGGVATESGDITSGLPRVEELFEARSPKGQALLSDQQGVIEIPETEDGSRKIRVVSSDSFRDVYQIPEGLTIAIESGQTVQAGDVLAADDDRKIVSQTDGQAVVVNGDIEVTGETREEHEYVVPHNARLRVTEGQEVAAGEQLTEGNCNPHDILRISGRDAVQRYLVDEVQRVYQAQGVNTNDKHIELVIRQMLRKVTIEESGDTELLPGEMVDMFTLQEVNARVIAEGGVPATAYTDLLGVTKASLNTNSFLSMASFQETTRVLTEAAMRGQVDRLRGLKENVIIGKLIPAGSGWKDHEDEEYDLPEEELGLIGLMQPD